MAGATALMARLAAPDRPMAWPNLSGGATALTKATLAANTMDAANPCRARSVHRTGPMLSTKAKLKAQAAIRRKPAIEARRYPRRSTVGPRKGTQSRAASEKMLDTRPICPGVAAKLTARCLGRR